MKKIFFYDNMYKKGFGDFKLFSWYIDNKKIYVWDFIKQHNTYTCCTKLKKNQTNQEEHVDRN